MNMPELMQQYNLSRHSDIPADKHSQCRYYTQGLFIGADQSGQNLLAMCCYQNKHPVEQITFDHPVLMNLRDRSISGVPRECSQYCSIPGHSNNERERCEQEPQWSDQGTVIKKLHLEQSLICNLTCISCSSRFSTGWNRDYPLFDPSARAIRLKKNVSNVWQHLDLSYLENLHFTGGEPLLNHDNLEILEHLDRIGRIGKVTATYNTNGTVRVTARTLELWKKMRWIRLHFSLDGCDKTFEYTRYPAKWTTVANNIQWYRAQSQISILIEVNAVVGIHNVFNLGDLYDWYQNQDLTGSQGDPSHIFVKHIEASSHGGRVLSLRHLPDSLKIQCRSMLKSLQHLPGSQDLLRICAQEPNLQWLEYFTKLDQLRGTDWKKDLSPLLQI